MRHILPAAVLVFLPLLAWSTEAPIGQEVEVQLVSGTVVHGTLVERTAEQVVIRCSVTLKGSSITSERTFPADQVQAVLTLTDEYQHRVASASATAPDQLALAHWCLDHSLPAEGRRHAEKTLALEPTNREALTLMHQLGLVHLDGSWRDIDEVLKAKDLVRYDGLVTDAATRDRLKQLMARKTTAAAALAAAKARFENLSGLLTAAKEHMASAEKQDTDSATLAAEAESRQKALDDAQVADAAAAERVQQTSNQVVTRHSDGSTSTTVNPALADAEAAKSRTDAAVDAAQHALGSTNATSAKARKAHLDQVVQKAHEDIDRLAKDLPLAEQAVPLRQQEADASATAYSAARDKVILPTDLPAAVRDFLTNEKH